jgi:putative glycosyltransferase (TIGR04372 family)
MRAMGMASNSKFICLNVRDDAYLASHLPSRDWSYHNYRNSDISNYALAAHELAQRGFYVVRMGSKVRYPLPVQHARVIDYATNGMRSDFMDMYLGAKCIFAISTGSGWDSIPYIFRRPICYVNWQPISYSPTYVENALHIYKHHWSAELNRELTFSEILDAGVGSALLASDYSSKGISLIENTPDEIRDVALEMADRISGAWVVTEGDTALQSRFWRLFPASAVDSDRGRPLHGRIVSRCGAVFLRKNQVWLS